MSTRNLIKLLALPPALLVVAHLAGCGGANDTFSPTTGPGVVAFTLSVSPASRRVPQGQSTTFTVTAHSVNGFSSPVGLTVTGLPTGATGGHAPSTVIPSAQGATSTLTVNTSAGTGELAGTVRSRASTPIGTHALTVTGTGGGITRTARVQLVVQAATVPYFMIAGGHIWTIQPGQVANIFFTVASVNGFTGTVTLSAAGLPPSSTAQFHPASVDLAANGTATAAVSIRTSAGTSPGTYTPLIVGTSGDLTNQAAETLVVVDVEASGRIVFVNPRLAQIMSMDDTTGGNVVGFGGSGTDHFSHPMGLAFDGAGRVYIADSGNNRIVRMDNLRGTNWTTFGTKGSGTGQFVSPQSVAIDGTGRIYVADTLNSRIVRFDDMTGVNWTAFGTSGSGVGQFSALCAVCVDTANHIYVADGSRIVRFDDMTGANWKTYGSSGSGDGQLTVEAVFVAADNRIYVADRENLRIVRIDDMDGANWTSCAAFNRPSGVFVAGNGRIYVLDYFNNEIVRVDDMNGTNRKTFPVTFHDGRPVYPPPTGIVVR